MSKKLIYVILMIILIGILLALLVRQRPFIKLFLSPTIRTNANLLVVEGWLPDSAIKLAVEEIKNGLYEKVVTTGIRSSDLDYCLVAMNGYLIFYPDSKSLLNSNTIVHSIKVVAKSQMGGIYSCHFDFFVNDSLLSSFTADNESREYELTWHGTLKEIDSLMIHFDNDMVDENGDRNLYVKEVMIDDIISIPYQFNSVFDIGLLDGQDRIVNNYETISELARNKLIRYGIDSSKVLALTGDKKRYNRTLSSVLTFRDWLNTNEFKTSDINIITFGIHARRTWLTYKSILKKSYNVGVISIPETVDQGSEELNTFKILEETMQLFYYWIILIPYRFT